MTPFSHRTQPKPVMSRLSPRPSPLRVRPDSGLRLGWRMAVFVGCLALAGCSGGAALETFDLSLPSPPTRPSPSARQLVVAEPVALQALESDRIVVRSADGVVSFLPGAQWSDRLPRLLQSRMVQTFENTGRSVGRAGNGIAADVILQSDIRFFGVSTVEGGQAVIEISAKLVDGESGRIQAARVFRSTTPVGAVSGKAAVAALDAAMMKILQEIVRWAGGRG